MVKSAALFALACCFAASVFVLEHTRVAAGAAPILKIEAVSPDSSSTGTLHYVDELRLSVGSYAPLIFKSELNGKLIPVPGPQYPIDDAHVLLLGWSSS